MTRCTRCGRPATLTVRNAYVRAANGKPVCRSNVCWGTVTGGYPAEGAPLTRKVHA